MKRLLLTLTALLMIATLLRSLFGTATAGVGEKVNYEAPILSAVNQDGVTVNFADLYKKGPTVVFFYPKAGTPGCTKQACSLRDAFADLTKQGLQVLGVSFDKQENQKKFKSEQKLPFDLIADPEGKVAEAFKVEKMLKGLIPLASRQCFLIKGGRVVWHDAKASTSEQADDIKRVLAELK